jgi:carboxymethylenebutenolidase
MTKRIDFDSKNGGHIQGELAEPAGAGKAPALIVIQEWWGVNDHVRSLVDRFAAAGFLALAPDLYHGKATKDPAEAMKLMQAFDWNVGVEDVAGALAYLEKHARSNGKVGITGFCMGGAVALASAAQLPHLTAVAPFYGIPDAKTDLSKLNGPVLGHFAKKDEHVSPAAAADLEKRLKDAGKKAEIHMYDANHAFMNDTRPEVYDAAQAKIAWERTTKFLHAQLG